MISGNMGHRNKNVHFTFLTIIIEALISKQNFNVVADKGEACWQSLNNRNVLKSNYVS